MAELAINNMIDKPTSKYASYVTLATGLTTFCWGCYNGIGNKDRLMKSPLSSLFVGTIVGSVYAIGGLFVQSFIPIPLQIIVPAITTIAILKRVNDEAYPAVPPPLNQNKED